MGVRGLNKFLLRNVKNDTAITTMSLKQLAGRTLAVDISIYVYHILRRKHGIFILNMYAMLCRLLRHGINPILVFDGTAPASKQSVVVDRQKQRKQAQHEYSQLLATSSASATEIELVQLEKLRCASVHATVKQYQDVRQLAEHMGITCIVASGEADEVCAQLVFSGVAWAVLSDDTDFLAYGCPRVLRDYRFEEETVVLYYLPDILRALSIRSLDDFRAICILLGTDHTPADLMTWPFFIAIQHYRHYLHMHDTNPEYSTLSFYEWMAKQDICVPAHATHLQSILDIYKSILTNPTNLPDMSVISSPKFHETNTPNDHQLIEFIQRNCSESTSTS